MPSLKVHDNYNCTPENPNFLESQNPLTIDAPAAGCTLCFSSPPTGSGGATSYNCPPTSSITFVAGTYQYGAYPLNTNCASLPPNPKATLPHTITVGSGKP